MLQLKEVLQSPAFQNFQLLAGEEGLEREVRSVSILEYEAVIDNFADFSADTLILTSLFDARENPGMLLEADVLGERRSLIEWVFEPLYSLKGKVGGG